MTLWNDRLLREVRESKMTGLGDTTCDRCGTTRPDVTIYSTTKKRCLALELTFRLLKESLHKLTAEKGASMLSSYTNNSNQVVAVWVQRVHQSNLRTCLKYMDLSNKGIRKAI